MSTTERDELATIFKGHPVSFGAYPKRLMTGHAQEIAEKILAAGYRKPRQVTTVEELDALPPESVVLSSTGHVYQHESEEDVTWWAHPGDQRVYASRQVRLPATVLHVGSL